MKKITYLALMVLIIASCEKEVNIPIEYTEPKLVVNGLFNTDSLWNIELSASKYIYDTITIPFVNDASVTITNSNGQSISLTNQGDGIYASFTEKPEIGEVYTISVFHDDYENVSSSNQLPGEVVIENIDWHQQISVMGELHRKVDITFQDSPEEGYYLVRMKAAYWDVFMDSLFQMDSILSIYPIDFFSRNSAVENSNPHNPQYAISFKDELFNGEQYTIDFILDEYYFSGGEFEKDIPHAIYISMSKISEEYYWYETSYRAYQSAQETKFFAQPVQVYTNIENGLGVFAGYSATLDSIMLR